MKPGDVIDLLDVRGPLPEIDEDGEPNDERETVPHVYALGPFGSWPVTLDEAKNEIVQHETWREGRSFRLGRVAVWETGWGFALKDNPEADAPNERRPEG